MSKATTTATTASTNNAIAPAARRDRVKSTNIIVPDDDPAAAAAAPPAALGPFGSTATSTAASADSVGASPSSTLGVVHGERSNVSFSGEKSTRSNIVGGSSSTTAAGQQQQQQQQHGLSAEEIQRRRAVELDDKRQKEWAEFQRLYRHESTSLLKVFLDVQIGDAAPGRLVIELLENCPRTAENFRELCLGHGGWDAQHGGVKLDYADTRCTRIFPGVGALFGDFGGLSLSSTGGTLNDENFSLRHNARGIVTMVSNGPNRIGSQFMICFDRASQFDFKHVPFARVVDGFNVLDKLEHTPTTAITHIPVTPVVISLCGALNGKKPQTVTPPAGVPLVPRGTVMGGVGGGASLSISGAMDTAQAMADRDD